MRKLALSTFVLSQSDARDQTCSRTATRGVAAQDVPHVRVLPPGALLLLADVLARGVLAPQDLPVGVLTAVLGGVYLLWRMNAVRKVTA